MATSISPNIEKQSISTVDALWTIIQSQTKADRKALAKRILEEENAPKAQKEMAKESLTKAFEELHNGMAKHDARSLFTK